MERLINTFYELYLFGTRSQICFSPIPFLFHFKVTNFQFISGFHNRKCSQCGHCCSVGYTATSIAAVRFFLNELSLLVVTDIGTIQVAHKTFVEYIS